MYQIYPFTAERNNSVAATADARNQFNTFLASDIAQVLDITQILQSESQTCSTESGMIEWSYTITFTVVAQLSPKHREAVQEKYMECIS